MRTPAMVTARAGHRRNQRIKDLWGHHPFASVASRLIREGEQRNENDDDTGVADRRVNTLARGLLSWFMPNLI
jgi:hypothetical protein